MFLLSVVYAELFFFAFFSASSADEEINHSWATDEGRLIDRLLHRSNYYKYVRPVRNASETVHIGFGLSLTMIMDMDEKNQILVTNVWITTKWLDNRLKWDPSDFNNLRKVRLPANNFWLPDIVLYNNADDYTSGYMPINLMIEHTGMVSWSPPARLKSSCKIDISYFPFDTQLCHLKFGSWTYDTPQLDLYVIDATADLTYYVKSGEWRLIRAWLVRNEISYPIDDSSYTDVTLFICLKRRILYYLLNILFPCLCLNVLSLLTFFVPHEAGEKVSLGITVLLSYSVFMLLVANTMPPTSDFIPLIGVYLTFSMGLTSISVILTVCILKIYHGGPDRSPVPLWLRRFSSCVGDMKCRLPGGQRKRVQTSLQDSCDLNSIHIDSAFLTPLKPPSLPQCRPPRNPNDPWIRQAGSEPFNDRSLHDISRNVRRLAQRCEEEMVNSEKEEEWHAAAIALDRFFFVAFLVGMVVISIVLLFLVPFSQETEDRICAERYHMSLTNHSGHSHL